MNEIYEMKGAGRSIGGIAEELGVARNTLRRAAPGVEGSGL